MAARAGLDLGPHVLFPEFFFVFAGNELNRVDERILNRRSQQQIENFLRPEHHEAHVEPDHFAAGGFGKSATFRSQASRTNECRFRQIHRMLNILKSRFHLFHRLRNVIIVPFSAKITKQQDGKQDQDNGQQNINIDDVQQMQDNRQHRRCNTSNNIPVQTE